MKDLPVNIVVEAKKKKQVEYTWVTVSCPLECGFTSSGMTITNNVPKAFNDALECSGGMHAHLRHAHREILEYYVENDYMPQLRLLTQIVNNV
jgi:hypothetical protein